MRVLSGEIGDTPRVPICALPDLHLSPSFPNEGDHSPRGDCEHRDLEKAYAWKGD